MNAGTNHVWFCFFYLFNIDIWDLASLKLFRTNAKMLPFWTQCCLTIPLAGKAFSNTALKLGLLLMIMLLYNHKNFNLIKININIFDVNRKRSRGMLKRNAGGVIKQLEGNHNSQGYWSTFTLNVISNSYDFNHFSLMLTLPVQWISETCSKIKTYLNFYFRISLWCLRRFY